MRSITFLCCENHGVIIEVGVLQKYKQDVVKCIVKVLESPCVHRRKIIRNKIQIRDLNARANQI